MSKPSFPMAAIVEQTVRGLQTVRGGTFQSASIRPVPIGYWPITFHQVFRFQQIGSNKLVPAKGRDVRLACGSNTCQWILTFIVLSQYVKGTQRDMRHDRNQPFRPPDVSLSIRCPCKPHWPPPTFACKCLTYIVYFLLFLFPNIQENIPLAYKVIYCGTSSPSALTSHTILFLPSFGER